MNDLLSLTAFAILWSAAFALTRGCRTLMAVKS
ncbi:hypothetical protein BH11CYA1_BH11CYA1_03650 [soil metagenome]